MSCYKSLPVIHQRADFSCPCLKWHDLEILRSYPTVRKKCLLQFTVNCVIVEIDDLPVQTGYCVYQGATYVQGQTWDDGCTFRCRCDDASKGLYICNDRSDCLKSYLFLFTFH